MLAKPHVFFRCDANPQIGMGHLIRSSAIAEMLSNKVTIHFIFTSTKKELVQSILPKNYKLHFLKGNEIPAIKKLLGQQKKSILNLDGYQFNSHYQASIFSSSYKVVCVDDLATFEYSCHALINQSSIIKKENYHSKTNPDFYLGLNYALLRKSFLSTAKKETILKRKQKSIFISFGGADSLTITPTVITRVLEILPQHKIHVLTGPVNTSVSEWMKTYVNDKRVQFHSGLNANQVSRLIRRCKIALVPSSSLSLEVCALRTPMITGITADNQLGLYKTLTRKKTAFGINDWQKFDIKRLKKYLVQLSREEKIATQMQLQQNHLIDGHSGVRIQKIYTSLYS
jgi:UDP-2,4-diacetamido-2,4,6-trideoxy-beta-L-altropyranose hydrolase